MPAVAYTTVFLGSIDSPGFEFASIRQQQLSLVERIQV